jgi:hypothetical protein
MISIIKNNFKILDLLLELIKKAGVNLSLQDIYGKSAIHYVVNPIVVGSYENFRLLKKLKENKFEFNILDYEGKSPMDYAQQ